MRSRAPISLFVPSCKPDGSFEPAQCHDMSGKCWCVDKNGNELAGTHQWGKPNCSDIGMLKKARCSECCLVQGRKSRGTLPLLSYTSLYLKS